MTIKTIVCASPDYLEQYGTPAHPRELNVHQCLVNSNFKQAHTWNYHDSEGHSGEVRVTSTIKSNNAEVNTYAAIQGQGILLAPTFIVYNAIKEGKLVPILTNYTWPTYDAYALYGNTRHLPMKIRAFIDFLSQAFEGEPYWDRVLKKAC